MYCIAMIKTNTPWAENNEQNATLCIQTVYFNITEKTMQLWMWQLSNSNIQSSETLEYGHLVQKNFTIMHI